MVANDQSLTLTLVPKEIRKIEHFVDDICDQLFINDTYYGNILMSITELFNTLCLRQTGRMQAIPIIIYGQKYWESVLNLQVLADEGVIADEHLNLISYAETPEEAWEIIAKFHELE